MREPALSAIHLAYPEVGAQAPRIFPFALRKEHAPVGESHVGVERVAAGNATRSGEAFWRRGRHVGVTRREFIQSGCIAPVGGDEEHAAVGGAARVARHPRRHGERRNARTAGATAHRARHRVGECAPPRGEGRAELVARGALEAPRVQSPRGALHKAFHGAVASVRAHRLDEHGAIHVRPATAGIVERRRGPRPQRSQRVVGGASIQDRHQRHPLGAPAVAELGLVVHREPLNEPRRRPRIGEEQRLPPEHRLRHAPPAARAVELEDVHQFVLHHEVKPVLAKTQRALVHRRSRKDHDARRRRHPRIPVGEVGVIGDHQVNAPARRLQQRRKLGVRALGAPSAAPRHRFQSGGKMDVEVGRPEGAPGFVGGLGGRRVRQSETECDRVRQCVHEASQRVGSLTHPALLITPSHCTHSLLSCRP